ncbi:hypothetical protein D3C86_1926140 [compost metagenome]
MQTLEFECVTTAYDRLKFYGQKDHVRIYGQDYQERISRFGLIIETLNIFDDFKQFGLNIQEDIFIACKPRE